MIFLGARTLVNEDFTPMVAPKYELLNLFSFFFRLE